MVCLALPSQNSKFREACMLICIPQHKISSVTTNIFLAVSQYAILEKWDTPTITRYFEISWRRELSPILFTPQKHVLKCRSDQNSVKGGNSVVNESQFCASNVTSSLLYRQSKQRSSSAATTMVTSSKIPSRVKD